MDNEGTQKNRPNNEIDVYAPGLTPEKCHRPTDYMSQEKKEEEDS